MSKSTRGRASSSSKKIRTLSTKSTITGRIFEKKILSGPRIADSIAHSNAERRQRRAHVVLSPSDIPELETPPWDDEWHNLNDLLDGTAPLDLSHAGGEFDHLLADYIREEINEHGKPKDFRTRRDRTEKRTQGFEQQMEGATDSYMEWANRMGDEGLTMGPSTSHNGSVENALALQVIDVFQTYKYSIDICTGDVNIPAAIIRHGLLPTAPLKPSFAFSIRVMELYRTTSLRCPHLTIEPFVKSLCDLHKIPFRQYLAQQFTFALDLYIAIRTNIRRRVDAALGCDVEKWRLKNACPACTYKLEEEGNLIFKMLFTMDGNDSLKRLRRSVNVLATDEDSEAPPQMGESRARQDSRTVSGDRYLKREDVDRWVKATMEEELADISKEELEDNPCAGRWTNMINEVTAKMWGIFDETGVFLALCRHGFTLLIADMVQSGELSKYPLAIVSALLDAFGDDLGGGYDIGCRFKTTVDQSDLGARARELRFTALVGSFHGHAHNRICQLSHLATYVKGMGLEDLEGCERFFSKSNHLAPSIRYATPFHRQQKIVEYMAHTDAFETEQKSSEFLVNNYRQALGILETRSALQKTMDDQGIASTDVFHAWLREEHAYLTSLINEPLEETLGMEYYQKLVNYHDAQLHNYSQRGTPLLSTMPQLLKKVGAKRAINPETQLRHAREVLERSLEAVHELEVQLSVVQRWTPECNEWKEAAIMVGRRRYQRCLDELERLVVSRMFELTKMNMSQTGYKLRKHIGKALKARSQAIRSALDRYNDAAALMSPPRASLSWNEIVEYAFLADFDLLRDTRQDVSERPWARPSARLAMDQYFKIERAHEEIYRLNIEIRR
ncbi:hypothetical protein H0H92_006579, partial [Tricholoma furcatifolium]